MFMLIINLIFIYACLSSATAKQTSCNFDDFNDCMKNTETPAQLNDKLAQQQTNAIENKLRNCFKNNGCNEPISTKDDKQLSPQIVDIEKRLNCFQKLSERADHLVEQCVQQTHSDFHFSTEQKQEDSSLTEQADKKLQSTTTFPTKENMAAHVNESCRNLTAREKVRNCMKDVWQKSIGDTRTSNATAKRIESDRLFQEMCINKSKCVQQLSIACQTQFNETKLEVCHCAETDLRSQRNQLDSDFENCLHESSGGRDKAQQHIIANQNDPKKSATEKFIKRYCPTEDPCNKNTIRQPNLSSNGPKLKKQK